MKRLAGTAVAIVVVSLFAGVAFATSVADRDDVTTGLDIAKVVGSHNRATDQLVHTIDFYGPISGSPASTSGKPPSSVCIEIWTRSTPGEAAPDYEACATPGAKGKGWHGSIARKRELGPQLRIGPVRVEQPTDTRLVLRIDPDDIKRPASYKWRAEATSFGSDCTIGTGCPDYAPDRPDTAQTLLGKPRR